MENLERVDFYICIWIISWAILTSGTLISDTITYVNVMKGLAENDKEDYLKKVAKKETAITKLVAPLIGTGVIVFSVYLLRNVAF